MARCVKQGRSTPIMFGLSYQIGDQLRKWKIKAPVDKDGKPVQIDGALAFHFESKTRKPHS